jgi:hypothetical protein
MEELMTLRDMTPEELELFEEAIFDDTDEPRLTLDTGRPERAREVDGDRNGDGLPDRPANDDGPPNDRVPS